MMELNDSLRVLAGILGSKDIQENVKDKAAKTAIEIMGLIEKNTEFNRKQLDEALLKSSKLMV